MNAARPLIRLSGTSVAALIEQYERAAEALDAASEALHRAAPHARDYADGRAIGSATVEFLHHLTAVRAARSYCEELIGHIRQEST